VSVPPEPKREVLEDTLASFKKEREQADTGYDEALTALDRAVWTPPEFPHPPPSPDETQITPLNERWQILRARPPHAGWRGRLARFVWGLVEPVFAEQQAFNSLLVDHVNRNIPQQREVARSIESSIATLRQQVELLCTFQSVLMQYLQRLTPFVNAKDYEFDALAYRRFEDLRSDLWHHNVALHGLTAGVQGLSDEFLKHVESLTSKVQRYDARIESVATAAATVQQQAAALKREIERLLTADRPGAASAATAAERSPGAPQSPGKLSDASTLAGDSALESWKYPAFEAAFRGSQDEIAARLSTYVPLFAGARDVLDVGCGRGEFIELLQQSGVTAKGLDLNFEMVEICRAKGLDVAHGDALSHLRALPDESLGGLFAAQVVEHLPPDYLLAFLSEAQRVLRPGARLVLETVNVACWYAFFQSYIRDITHAKPLHPDTLQYLVTASGFTSVEVQLRVPLPEASRLRKPPRAAYEASGTDRDALIALASVVENNVERLNALLFTYLDYAVVATRA
jgi:SAM-dependent methyltransferase/prefoldin subunit 5